MLWLEGGAREGAKEGGKRPRGRMFGDRRSYARPYRAKRLGAAERHQGAPPRHLRGAWVNPYTAALEAGLDPDSTHYRVAMEYLQAEDVLEEAEESRELGGGGPLYTITLRDMQMLREV